CTEGLCNLGEIADQFFAQPFGHALFVVNHAGVAANANTPAMNGLDLHVVQFDIPAANRALIHGGPPFAFVRSFPRYKNSTA
ncbi:MAG TPA: hypothetical protein VFA70_04290, partial [Dehalococcoidia bacterium]|nr:hypothetical protein [Dehalococcoidia bacterium]